LFPEGYRFVEPALATPMGTLQQSPPIASGGSVSAAQAGELPLALQRAFATAFTIVDGATGSTLQQAADQPACDESLRSELCREVSRRGRPELLADEDPFVVLAIPWVEETGEARVALAVFLARQLAAGEDVSRAAAALGISPQEAACWAARRTPWPPDALARVASLVLEHLAARQRIDRLQAEAANLAQHMAATLEMISLLHRLTQNLKISKSEVEMSRLALEWLDEVLPARGMAVQWLPRREPSDSLGRHGDGEPILLVHGQCPLDNRQFIRLMDHLVQAHAAAAAPVVLNRGVTSRDDWPGAPVRQMIVVPIAEGENLLGWLAAFDHVSDGEFGTDEASLLGSVASILGIHSGNIALYQQQADLMAGIIRALTAAIDAKDEYTCGHSDRVARMAVRLAKELGCDAPMLNTIYLSGLLHDIGKIGIADSVLRKPGKLSDEEFRHIQTHPEIGHRILRDLGKLEDILPVILHHHEAWDGGGYPNRLQSDAIPLAARIIAVADSCDAMSSDRPYRQGMPQEKVEAILREGAGRQWSPEVIDAFFRARDDIRAIIRAPEGEAEAAPGRGE
jgi:HD-GYP domain-containing protein (c-di-GMP phosphodiesterase class II)